jgi:hypothetical protein
MWCLLFVLGVFVLHGVFFVCDGVCCLCVFELYVCFFLFVGYGFVFVVV